MKAAFKLFGKKEEVKETPLEREIREQGERNAKYCKEQQEKLDRTKEQMKNAEELIRQTRNQTEISIQELIDTMFKVRKADLFHQKGSSSLDVYYFDNHFVCFEFNGFIMEVSWRFLHEEIFYPDFKYKIHYHLGHEAILIATNKWETEQNLRGLYISDKRASQDSSRYFEELTKNGIIEPLEWICSGDRDEWYVKRTLISSDMENIVWLHDGEEPWMKNFSDTLKKLSDLAELKEKEDQEREIEKIEDERQKKVEAFLRKTELLRSYFEE